MRTVEAEQMMSKLEELGVEGYKEGRTECRGTAEARGRRETGMAT
jgi:hypothetical protein